MESSAQRMFALLTAFFAPAFTLLAAAKKGPKAVISTVNGKPVKIYNNM